MKSQYDQELTEELEQAVPEIEAWAKVRNVRLFHVSDDR